MESKRHNFSFISYKHSGTIENVENELHILDPKITKNVLSQFKYYYQHHILPLALLHQQSTGGSQMSFQAST